MSFLKINDPKKRDVIVREFLALKNKIKTDDLNKVMDDSDRTYELEEFFKPVTKSSNQLTEQLSQLTLLPPIVDSPTLEPIEATTSPAIEGIPHDMTTLGPRAQKYLSTYLRKDKSGDKADRTYGIKKEGHSPMFIGKDRVDVDEDDIIMNGKRYEGTEGLWRLITLESPKDYTENDLKQYEEILINSNAIENEERPGYPKSSRSGKWKTIINPIWRKQKKQTKKEQKGKGVRFLPSHPDSLVERLQLLLKSQSAGNTSLSNEIVSICDELLKQSVLNDKDYKKIIFANNKK